MPSAILTAVVALLLLQPSPKAPAEIGKLIRQLGSDDFAEREAAQKKLEALGEPALERLRKAAAESDDFEIKSRSQLLIQSIAAKVLGAELTRLQGTWKLAQVGDGVGFTMPAPHEGSFQIVFAAEKFTWKGDGFLSLVDMTGRVALAQQRGTRTIDFCANSRPPLLGIYAVEGATLKLRIDFVQDNHRPESLEAQNPRELILVFQRDKR
jgi:uncharacterized protein (TIGR03067 family)